MKVEDVALRALRGAFASLVRRYPLRFRHRLELDMLATFDAGARAQLDERGWVALGRFTVANFVYAFVELVRVRRTTTSADSYRATLYDSASRIRRDLSWSVRSLLRTPSFTIAALLTLALGVGLNAVAFAVLRGAILQPLRFPEAERIVAIQISQQGRSWWSASPADVVDWRQRTQVFDEVAYGRQARMGVLAEADPELMDGVVVSPNFFATLGVEPAHGSGFDGLTAEESETAVVLSHSLWQQRFAEDMDVLGRTLVIDGRPRVVVGVLGKDFSGDFLSSPEIYVAHSLEASDAAIRVRSLRPIARLAAGADLDQAQAELERVARQLEIEHPVTMTGWRAHAVTLHEQMVGPTRPVLLFVQLAVGFVLLVACANVSSLLLARGEIRGSEWALCRALGARRLRIVWQLMLESLVLALAGGAAGLAAAAFVVASLRARLPQEIPRAADVTVDGSVVLFTLVLTVCVGVVLGLLPARVATGEGAQLAAAGQRSTDGRARLAFRSALMGCEIALVMVLMTGAGLMLRSVEMLRRVDPGFETSGAVAVEVPVSPERYSDRTAIDDYFARLIERVEALPGVVAAGAVTALPLRGSTGATGYLNIEGRHAAGVEEPPLGAIEGTTTGYFAAMQMPILAGRGFGRQDDADARRVAVINDAAARLYWPDSDPIGARISPGRPGDSGEWPEVFEIVGVVRGIRYGVNAEVRPRIYVASSQVGLPGPLGAVVVRTDNGDATSLIAGIRDAMRALDADQPMGAAMTFEAMLEDSVSQPRLQAVLFTSFAVIALALGVVGVYGVVGFLVGQRRAELGVRRALGAGVGSLHFLVLRAVMIPVVGGVLAGAVGAWILGRTFASFIPAVSAHDPATFLGVGLLLLATSVAATLVPGRRAAHLDPARLLADR